MKTIFLIRHAKSSWEDYSLKDIERPLNTRGKRDAPFMSKVFQAKEGIPELLISSPALRAKTTAYIFAEQLGIPQSEVRIVKEIYEAYTTEILYIIKEIENDYNTIVLFGHNPSITDVANIFGDQYVPNVPTCGIIKISSSAESWADFDKTNAKLSAFHFPKQYLDKIPI